MKFWFSRMDQEKGIPHFVLFNCTHTVFVNRDGPYGHKWPCKKLIQSSLTKR